MLLCCSDLHSLLVIEPGVLVLRASKGALVGTCHALRKNLLLIKLTTRRSCGRVELAQNKLEFSTRVPFFSITEEESTVLILLPLDACPCLCRPRYVLFDPVSLDKSTWVRTPASLQQATNTNEWYSCGIVRRRLETWAGFAATSAGLELRPGRYMSAPPALQPVGHVRPLPRGHPAAPRRLPALTNHVPFSSAIKVQLKCNTTTTL